MTDDEKTAKLLGIVRRVFPDGAADWLVEYGRQDGFTNAAGEIDEEKVYGHMTAIYTAQQQHPQSQPGDTARAELAKRYPPKVGADDNGNTPNASSNGIQPGSRGRAAVNARYKTQLEARRHGRTNQ